MPPYGQVEPSVLMDVPRVTSTQVTVPATDPPISRQLLMVTEPLVRKTELVAPSSTLWVTLAVAVLLYSPALLPLLFSPSAVMPAASRVALV